MIKGFKEWLNIPGLQPQMIHLFEDDFKGATTKTWCGWMETDCANDDYIPCPIRREALRIQGLIDCAKNNREEKRLKRQLEDYSGEECALTLSLGATGR